MGLISKSRYCSGRNITGTSSSMTYASIMSRDSVIIAFLIAALNYFDIFSLVKFRTIN